MPEAPVTPEVVKWAIDESGMSVQELAERLKVEPSVVSSWSEGRDKPSKGQLTKLAEKLKRPRAMFFLPAAPAQSSLPHGLRSAAGVRDNLDLSFDERLCIRRARRLQELLATIADRAPAIPTGSQAESPQDVAQRFRAWAEVNWETQREWKTASRAFRGWRAAIEANGVAVLALQLGKEGIRGFALNSERAPMIAVNTADIPEARSFTLFHELAHLALGGDSSCAGKNRGGIERWCDRVASHTLIPRDQLRTEKSLQELDDLALIKRTARRFQVSRRAAALALEEVGAAESLYGLAETAWPTLDREKGTGGRGGEGGRTSPRICIAEYGHFAVGSFISALSDGKVSELQARDYLRLDHTQLSEASQLLSEGAG